MDNPLKIPGARTPRQGARYCIHESTCHRHSSPHSLLAATSAMYDVTLALFSAFRSAPTMTVILVLAPMLRMFLLPSKF